MWEVLIAISSGFPWWLSGKESACNAGDLGMIPWVGKNPLEEETAAYFSILAWKVPWTEEPSGPQSMGS